jgi:hypothetical protein
MPGKLAAARTTRRRRIGPFRLVDVTEPARRLRELSIWRVRFPQDVARRALAMAPDETETLVIELRR